MDKSLSDITASKLTEQPADNTASPPTLTSTHTQPSTPESSNETQPKALKTTTNVTTLGSMKSKASSSSNTLPTPQPSLGSTVLGGIKNASSKTTLGRPTAVKGVTLGTQLGTTLGAKSNTVLGKTSSNVVSVSSGERLNTSKSDMISGTKNLEATPKPPESNVVATPTVVIDDNVSSSAKAPVKKSLSKVQKLAAARQKQKAEQERLAKEEEQREQERLRQEEEANAARERARKQHEEDLQRKQQERKRSEEQRKREQAEKIRLEKMNKLGIVVNSDAQSKVKTCFRKTKRKPNTDHSKSCIDQEQPAAVSTLSESDTVANEKNSIAFVENNDNSHVAKNHRGGTKIKENWDDESESAEADVELKPELKVQLAETVKIDEKSSREEVGVKKSTGGFRSPICCVLGHVDTGKTKLLDKIRNTNIQDGEVGGITQQIGVTYVPVTEILKMADDDEFCEEKASIKVPGLLMVDTPGHASFSSLRDRGSSLCDISILVVDIKHGLEKLTLESLKLLKKRKVPFVVALNKVDSIHGWANFKHGSTQKCLNNQSQTALREFESRLSHVITQFAEQGLNANLFTRLHTLKEFSRTVCIIPTSAVTGEGIGDLLFTIIRLVQKLDIERILMHQDEFKCSVLEVNFIEGLGRTLDAILISGTISDGDKFMVCGFDGPIVSTVKALLTPPPSRELRMKSNYMRHKVLHAAQGVKIVGTGLDRALAGSQLYLIKSQQQIKDLEKIVLKPLEGIKNRIKTVKTGVYIQASTVGSLEALLDFLNDECHIPVFDFGLGSVHLKDVKNASVMIEHNPDYACILAFDVKIQPDAQLLAEKLKVKILEADVIYTLQDMFTRHLEELALVKQKKAAATAIFPCKLKIIPEHIIRTHDPIVIGVNVEAGLLKKGTPICVWSKTKESYLCLGVVTDIQKNQKPVAEANPNEQVAICITPSHDQQKYSYSRHFDQESILYSLITRNSLNSLKEGFAEFCKKPQNFLLLKTLKQLFDL